MTLKAIFDKLFTNKCAILSKKPAMTFLLKFSCLKKKKTVYSRCDDLNTKLNEARLFIYEVDISEHLKAHSTEGAE